MSAALSRFLIFQTLMFQSASTSFFFLREGYRRNIVFQAGDRPWQWCIGVHIPSFSLINMQLPGGEQMARSSSPPAGCCRHATGISVGTTAGPGSPLGSGFYPTLRSPSCPAQTWAERTGLLTKTHCPGTITNAINKVKNVPCHQLILTRCVSRMCQIVSWWHVLILSGVLSVYFFIALFVHELYINKCFMDLWFVLPD